MLRPCSRSRGRRPRRVPIMLQMSATECGAACLAMVLTAFGRATRIAECRDRLEIGRDGANGLRIAQLARNMGLSVRALSVDLHQARNLRTPAIIHWNFNHYVVLERWDGARAVVVDPALGRRTLDRQEFSDGFTGVALELSPTDEFRKRRRNGALEAWRFVRGLMGTSRATIVGVLVASLLLQLIMLAPPVMTKIVVDVVVTRAQARLLPAMVGAGLLLLATNGMAFYVRGTLLNFLQARMDRELMSRFFGRLLSLPYRYFVLRGSGDLLMRLSSNSLIREVITSQTLSFVLDGAFVVGYIGLLLAIAPLYGWVSLGLGAAQVVIMMLSFRSLRVLAQQDVAAQAQAQSRAVEVLTGVETVKAMGAEEEAYSRWSALFDDQLRASLQRNRRETVLEAVLGVFRTGTPMILLWLGAWEVLAGDMTVGTMLAYNTLAGSLLTPMATLFSATRQLQTVGVNIDRIRDVLDEPPEQEPGAAREHQRIKGRVALHRVGFHYGAESGWAVRDVSLELPPGAKVAFVGATGSGKTTLARLVLGLYQPTEGDVRFDGRSLTDLDLRALRRQCGVVTQDPALFACSVRENIAFGHDDVTFDDVVRAARLAQIHDEIVAMPMGFETVLSEGGGGLSGGQRQRLALARALVRDPALLVLDEATSHLDVATEQRVDEVLSRLSCTRVVIAHRLSTVMNADLIAVLKDGRVVETGTHVDLMARRGHYAALVNGQVHLRGAAGSRTVRLSGRLR